MRMMAVLVTFRREQEQEPRRYETTTFCVLNIPRLLRDGCDLFLTSNGAVLVYDDVP